MMLYGRFIHLVPFVAVGLLHACGGGAATNPPDAARLSAPPVGVIEPQPGASVRDFDLLPYEPVSGITSAQNVVIRNAAEFSALWAAHMRNRVPVPPVPAIDFTQKMVVGVFVGQLNHGCGGVALHHVRNEGAKLTVAYSATTAMPEVCTMVMGSPAALAVVERSDAAVEFAPSAASTVAMTTIDATQHSLVQVARTAIVKDQAAWSALWAEHKGSGVAAPSVDFTRNMVVAAFKGPGDACAGIKLAHALRSGAVVTVRRTLQSAGPGMACAQVLTTPAHIVTMERTGDQVVFATEKEGS